MIKIKSVESSSAVSYTHRVGLFTRCVNALWDRMGRIEDLPV